MSHPNHIGKAMEANIRWHALQLFVNLLVKFPVYLTDNLSYANTVTFIFGWDGHEYWSDPRPN